MAPGNQGRLNPGWTAGVIRGALHDEDTCLNVGVLMQASLFILHRVID